MVGEKIPQGYTKLSGDMRCRCARLYLSASGDYYCCNAKPEPIRPPPPAPFSPSHGDREYPDQDDPRQMMNVITCRPVLYRFAEAMETKLRKNDHKTSWRNQPVEALVRLLLLELEEYKVSDDFFPVRDTRLELVDIANYCLILWDRLGMLDQDKPRHAKQPE